MSLMPIIAALLFTIGAYGLVAGTIGVFSSKAAARIGAKLAGTAPYVSMATLGLFGFIGSGALILVEFEAPHLETGLWSAGFTLLFAVLFWLTGIAPAILYVLLSRVRIRVDEGRHHRYRFDLLGTWWKARRREETHDEKIENTIATAGILGTGVGIINAVLGAKLFDLEFGSGGEIFGFISLVLVLTVVFAAGALQRFDAFE